MLIDGDHGWFTVCHELKLARHGVAVGRLRSMLGETHAAFDASRIEAEALRGSTRGLETHAEQLVRSLRSRR